MTALDLDLAPASSAALIAAEDWLRLDTADGAPSPQTLRAYLADWQQHFVWLGARDPQSIEEETDRLLAYILPRREVFRAMPDGQDVLLSVAARVIEIANDIWPERRVPAPRPVPVMVIPEDVIALPVMELA